MSTIGPNISDPRLSDWAYQDIADEDMEPTDNAGISLSEVSEGQSDQAVAATISGSDGVASAEI